MINFKNIYFENHLPMEFLYSMFAIGTGKHFSDMIREFDLEPNEKIIAVTAKMTSALSSYLSQELKYFFDLPGLGYILYKHILRNHHLKSIDHFLKDFETVEAIDFAYDVVKSVCKSNLSGENTSEYNNFGKSTAEMIMLVNQTIFQNSERKQRVLEILENPEESKQRLNLLLKQFYTRCFSPIESDITNIISESIVRYKSEFNNSPKEFMDKYFNFDLTSANTEVVIHTSFFKYVSWHNYSLYSEELADWFILGIYSDLLFNKNLSSERLAAFFKSLSDINRIEILKLLSERPWFGQELAEKLNITPATVSYHMAFLQRIGAVTFIRSDNRSYYSLNNAKFIRMLEDFTSFFKAKPL
ncbi:MULTISPECIES: metalloregulator ArsR/SmtB family transcription factor [unclassified Clostridium]|uniref:ArsR/SmtB family transcription factor n=1 Tax=unclassified Clostridium TaxID=2614128 RepID=UPI0002983026|nr:MULTISPECIES: metalloregulator ArsR/SmtB family transcription factor [unclassified Clostridium]EKQ57886.1 MAG: putative transcriptional regulator [Clostridium sp. Maddingley MBC34-26]